MSVNDNNKTDPGQGSEGKILIETARTDSFTMDYFRFGNGEKVFVILPGLSIQSVMKSADIIAAAYDKIARGFTVYVFDRRNELPASYSVYDIADDTAKVMNAVGLKDVYLFGASQGGMAALALAARYPSLVRKLMLGSSAARVTAGQYKNIARWIDLALKKDRTSLCLEMGRALYPGAMFEQSKDLFVKMSESITDEELSRFVIMAQAAKGFDITDGIGGIKCPVLSLGSADDKVLPGAAEDVERLFRDHPGFESYIYSGYSHASFDTAPDYKDRLLSFMLS